jgi:hypothetical protein
MSSRYIDPFDFQKLLNYFIGNNILFAFMFFIICSWASAYFGFSNKIYYFILVIGLILFGVFVGVDIYILVLILIGGFIFKEVARLVA